jgi:ribosomal protein L37AE/L43A
MFKNEEALNDVRRKVAEKMKKDGDKLIFGWRGEPEPTRKEGDEWVDVNGKKWTIKGGIRQSVTKLDSAKTPYWCPKCSKPMNHRFDIKFWRIRGHCFDCNIKAETELRRQGKWQEFEHKTLLRNYIAKLRDTIAELQDYHDTVTKPEFVNADETKILMIEKWDVDIEKVKSDLRADIANLQKMLDDTITEFGTGEDNETKNEVVTGTDEVNS